MDICSKCHKCDNFCVFFQGKFPVLSHESNLELFLCIYCRWAMLVVYAASLCLSWFHPWTPSNKCRIETLLVFSVTNFLLQNLVLSHVSNYVSSFCAFTAVWSSNSNALVFSVLLSYHPHITSQRPNQISVFLFSFSFNFPQNASIFKKNLPEGQIKMSHNTFRKQSAHFSEERSGSVVECLTRD